MNFLKKLFTIGTNVVTEAGEKTVDNLVDIRREGNGIIRKLDSNIKAIESRVEDAQVSVNLAKLEIKESEPRITAMNKVAKRAVKSGNDGDALNALSQVESMEMMNTSHQSTIETLEPIIKEQLANVRTLKTERNQLQSEITRLDIEEKAYKAKLQLLGGGAGDMAFNVDELRNRVKRVKAQVDAKQVIKNNSVENLEQKYNVSGSSATATAQERLEALKAKNSEKED